MTKDGSHRIRKSSAADAKLSAALRALEERGKVRRFYCAICNDEIIFHTDNYLGDDGDDRAARDHIADKHPEMVP